MVLNVRRHHTIIVPPSHRLGRTSRAGEYLYCGWGGHGVGLNLPVPRVGSGFSDSPHAHRVDVWRSARSLPDSGVCCRCGLGAWRRVVSYGLAELLLFT